MTWSHANATFELVQAVLTWVSVFRLLQEKKVQGVYAPTILFSTVWAIVALPYYATHNDFLSLVPCTARALGLAVWSVTYFHFRLTKPDENPRSGRVRLISSRRLDRSRSRQ